jgi:hypothetical protein
MPFPLEPPSTMVVVAAANCRNPAIRYSNLDSLKLSLMDMRSWTWKYKSLESSYKQNNINVVEIRSEDEADTDANHTFDYF